MKASDSSTEVHQFARSDWDLYVVAQGSVHQHGGVARHIFKDNSRHLSRETVKEHRNLIVLQSLSDFEIELFSVLVDVETGPQLCEFFIMLIISVNIDTLQLIFVLIEEKEQFANSGGGPSLTESFGVLLFDVVVHSDHCPGVDEEWVLLHFFVDDEELLNVANGMAGVASIPLLIAEGSESFLSNQMLVLFISDLKDFCEALESGNVGIYFLGWIEIEFLHVVGRVDGGLDHLD